MIPPREDSPPPYTTNLLKLLFLTTHYKSDDYTDQFPLYTVPHYITRKKHPGHDNYLYQRWNNLTARSKTKKTHKTNQRLVVKRSTTKDDTSVTSTLKTLCTQDTRFSHSNNVANDTILSITIWNQPISQYRIPPQPNTGHQSRGHPSTAVRTMICFDWCVQYNKIINLSKLPCLLSFFNSIICVVLSCYILLANSFTMVKIDDRYPDEWND